MFSFPHFIFWEKFTDQNIPVYLNLPITNIYFLIYTVAVTGPYVIFKTKLMNLEAVSYTHLDVYKRQHIEFIGLSNKQQIITWLQLHS